eukprot:TRINITY_DN81922_c0_g1_i1.p1 TRINITY_DN81922_c0_g1~~TRINITY_DN81922_c0_g1_i1.p1  ORF type:complete len:1650 (+),score=464.82 TRINITY_DN81922_c0_g1_i1:172-5121(+)
MAGQGPLGKDAFLEALDGGSGGGSRAGSQLEEDSAASDDEEEDSDEGGGIGADTEEEEEEEEDELADVRQPGGILAPSHAFEDVERTVAERKQVRAYKRVQREYEERIVAADNARSVLDYEEQRLRDLRRQLAKGGSVDPHRLGHQEAQVGRAWSALTDAESARDKAELAVHHLVDRGARAHSHVDAELALNSLIARARQEGEVQRATSIVQRDAEAKQLHEERKLLEADETERRDEEAADNQKKGRRRLKATQAEQTLKRVDAEQVADNRFDHDASRVLGLKKSIDKINRNIQASNEKRRKAENRQKADQAARKRELLEKGQNPYEVFRKERIEADKQTQIKETEEKRVYRSEKLLEQMQVEDVRYKAKLKEDKTKRLDMEEFQRQMGNYAREKKVAAYIRKMTIGNVEVIDPTGTALRIDASKVTVQKTHAFGLGRVSMDEIKKVDKDVKKAQAHAAAWKPPRGPVETDDPTDLLGGGDGPSQRRDDDDDSEATEALPEGKLWVPKLTKLEQQYLAAARERQKENMTSVQRCWGKEFKGDAFLAKPSVIAFNDFEVGKRYRQVVEVTNVSLTFNQFKLLPLDDRVKEFFEVEFVPPGRMSAGVTRYITVWFLPKVSKDIVTTFPILAKTGRIDFPMKCTTKKTVLTITPQDAEAQPIIDFGQVLRGEQCTRTLYIKNSGALGAEYCLEPTEKESDFLQALSWECSGPQLVAHGTTRVKFTFKPTVVGDFTLVFRLSINNRAVGDAKFVEERRVLVRGTCSDVAIWVEKAQYDLKTCLYEHIFRENIVVHNRGSTAMKVTVEKPKTIEGELQMNPSLAFIQGHSEQAIQVKFCPKRDFLDKYQQYQDRSKGVLGAFRIPVQILGADQVLPVNTELVGQLATGDIRFEPLSLNFGKCFVGASMTGRLSVINDSLLPQQFAFMRLPSTLVVADLPRDVQEEEDADGTGHGCAVLDGGGSAQFGRLMPRERRELVVTYTPDSTMDLQHNINFKTICGSLCVKDYMLECKGQGAAPLMEMSHTEINMASIPINSVSKESVVITNTSKVPTTINLLLPPVEVSGLHATPVCCTLQPKESRRIQIEFKPTSEYYNLLDLPEPPAEDGGGDPPADDAAAEEPAPKLSLEEHRVMQLRKIRTTGGRRWEAPAEEFPQSEEAAGGAEDTPHAADAGGEETADAETTEERSSKKRGPITVHSSWRLAIVMKQEGQDDKKRKAMSAAKQKAHLLRNSTMYLGLKTCVLPSVLTAEPAILNFGEVTAGQREILPITLHNALPGEPQELHMEALPENACFTVLNAPRHISDKPFQLVVEFNPERVQIYQSVLRLYTQNTRMQVPLKGRGVRPILKIEPEDGIINLGGVVYSKAAKDYVTAELQIKNASPFELRYKLESIVPVEQSYAGPSPFTLTPSQGVVEGNGQKTVTVSFRPHRPLELFREKILVNVPNQREPTFVYLFGHCFAYQGFAIPSLEYVPFGRVDTSIPDAFADRLAVGEGSGTAPEKEFAYPRAQQKNFTLTFEKEERSKFVLLGASAVPGTPWAPQAATAVNYDIQIQQSAVSQYFTVEAPEGNKADKMVKGGPLQPGKVPIKAVFRYNPPETGALTCGDVNLDMLEGIGQWITCKVKCVIAGGFVPPPDAPNATQEINIELRAYLQQI